MYLLILITLIFIISVTLLIVSSDDYEIPFSFLTILSGIILVVTLIAIPVGKNSDLECAIRLQSQRETLSRERQISDFERVFFAKEIMEINVELKRRQYWAHSNWYSIFHNIDAIDTLKPL